LADEGYRPLADDKAMAVQQQPGCGKDLEEEVRQLTLPAILVRGALSKLVSKAAWKGLDSSGPT